MPLLNIIPTNTSFKFMSLRKIGLFFSVTLILISFIAIFTKGLNFGIDFTGGVLIEIRSKNETINLTKLRDDLNKLNVGEIQLQTIGSEKDIAIRVQKYSPGQDKQLDSIKKIKSALANIEIEFRRTEYVGPKVGKELIKAGLIAVIFSLLGILFYIWLRFEWFFALGAIIALIHDVFLTIGFFSIFQFEFNLATVAAVLTIAGYSINDTVVIYDRIRETSRKYKKVIFEEIINLSLNSTLSRTLMTSLTTLLALLALFIFGGNVISSFVIALIWGVIIGTYSSLYVASPILLILNADKRNTSNQNEY
ncbi:MAG: hypothetical protein CFH23_00529 [Alphaproteobacteria bacterium MarineAlpha6_Bin1]|nr:MAG: hypothetical protein CFH23_00529 [Alphaproteobacteria bacterium MarineAlpha6_Bin1]